MYKHIKTAKKRIPNLFRYGINTLYYLYLSGYISKGVLLNILKRKKSIVKHRKAKQKLKRIKSKPKPKRIKSKPKHIKSTNIVKHRKGDSPKNWFSMLPILQQYEFDYSNLKLDGSGDIVKYYRNRTRKYFKLLNLKPKLPPLNKRIRKYYVYVILKAREVSPSIHSFSVGDYVLKKFIWKNKKLIPLKKLIELLLSYEPSFAKEDFHQIITDKLHQIFMNSERYDVIEFVGIYFKV